MSSADLPRVEASPSQASAHFRASLEVFPTVCFRVTGTCMLPALAPGEVVQVTSAERARPRFGDVILLSTREGPKLHRLVWAPLFGRGRTRGDRAPGFDGPLDLSAVLGTVVGVEREGGLSTVCSRTQAILSLLRGIAARLRRALRRP